MFCYVFRPFATGETRRGTSGNVTQPDAMRFGARVGTTAARRAAPFPLLQARVTYQCRWLVPGREARGLRRLDPKRNFRLGPGRAGGSGSGPPNIQWVNGATA